MADRKIRSGRGFTLLEMVTVLAISLMLMTLIVPVFQVTTKTVQNVERKLALYESARNMLDLVEAEVQLAIANEKGEHFSIKHVSWLDTDVPFTRNFPGPVVLPGAGDAGNIAYKCNRRVSDALNYVRVEGHGINASWVPTMRMFPGGKFFPLQCPVMDSSFPEAWKCSMRSTLLYQHDFEATEEVDSDALHQRWSRPEQLTDVSQIELCFIFQSIGSQWQSNTAAIKNYADQCPNFLGPGRETKIPHLVGAAGKGTIEFLKQRRLGQVKIMDLAISYWDDTQKQFTDLPENTVVYFFPMPKCVRITITVCDPDKRGILTLSRVVQLPCGSGDGNVLANTNDSAYYTDKLQPNNTIHAVFNRTKYLPTLPNAFNGDGSRGNFTDYTTATENTIITSDGVKPYNWP
jgi:prepilin-type N-terminal cleavage/methylation domain-containing protein